MARLQIVSDIHLPHWAEQLSQDWNLNTFIDPDTSVDALVLAGDIGVPDSALYTRLLDEASRTFKRVLVVSGNHEAYGMTLAETDSLMRAMCARHTNVHYLQMDAYDFPGTDVRVVGCTLWTDVPQKNQDVVQAHLSDYRAVFSDAEHNTTVAVVDLNNIHREHVDFIRHEIVRAERDCKTLIVATHHLPSFGLIHARYRAYTAVNSAFATELTDLLVSPVHTWIAGHTHTPITKVINDVRCVVNPFGYPSEPQRHDRRLVVDVEGPDVCSEMMLNSVEASSTHVDLNTLLEKPADVASQQSSLYRQLL